MQSVKVVLNTRTFFSCKRADLASTQAHELSGQYGKRVAESPCTYRRTMLRSSLAPFLPSILQSDGNRDQMMRYINRIHYLYDGNFAGSSCETPKRVRLVGLRMRSRMVGQAMQAWQSIGAGTYMNTYILGLTDLSVAASPANTCTCLHRYEHTYIHT